MRCPLSSCSLAFQALALRLLSRRPLTRLALVLCSPLRRSLSLSKLSSNFRYLCIAAASRARAWLPFFERS
jgi:hypothetical protein